MVTQVTIFSDKAKHLSQLGLGQAAIALAKREKLDAEFRATVVEPIKKQAQQRKAQARGKPRGQKASLTEQIREQSDRHERETDSVLARGAGTNERYLKAARWLLEHHPDAVQAIERGEMSISQARQRKAQAGGKPRGQKASVTQQIGEQSGGLPLRPVEGLRGA